MTFPRALEFLLVIAFALMSTSCVSSYDYITNVTATNVGMDVFTLEWKWVIDDYDDLDPYGCRIVTSLDGNIQQVVHEVEIEGNDTFYTVQENLTSWEIYKSCITPILRNGSAIRDGDEPACSDRIQTDYDPWTMRGEIAVIISGGFIFLLLVAQFINFKWPRDQKRTFTLDNLDEADGDDEVFKTESINDHENLGFEQDEDATSSVNDWNAAAAAAVVERKGGRMRGQKQWVKTADVHHLPTKLIADTKDGDDVNHNVTRDQAGRQPPVDDLFKDNTVGSVEEGVPADVDTNNLHMRYQQEHQHQEPQQLPNQIENPYQPTYQNQEYHQPQYQNQEPRHSAYQNQEFSDDYGQAEQDEAARDHVYRNYGYEDELDNPYGYDQVVRRNPRGRGLENEHEYATNIPSYEDDYSQYF